MSAIIQPLPSILPLILCIPISIHAFLLLNQLPAFPKGFTEMSL